MGTQKHHWGGALLWVGNLPADVHPSEWLLMASNALCMACIWPIFRHYRTLPTYQHYQHYQHYHIYVHTDMACNYMFQARQKSWGQARLQTKFDSWAKMLGIPDSARVFSNNFFGAFSKTWEIGIAWILFFGNAFQMRQSNRLKSDCFGLKMDSTKKVMNNNNKSHYSQEIPHISRHFWEMKDELRRWLDDGDLIGYNYEHIWTIGNKQNWDFRKGIWRATT